MPIDFRNLGPRTLSGITTFTGPVYVRSDPWIDVRAFDPYGQINRTSLLAAIASVPVGSGGKILIKGSGVITGGGTVEALNRKGLTIAGENPYTDQLIFGGSALNGQPCLRLRNAAAPRLENLGLDIEIVSGTPSCTPSAIIDAQVDSANFVSGVSPGQGHLINCWIGINAGADRGVFFSAAAADQNNDQWTIIGNRLLHNTVGFDLGHSQSVGHVIEGGTIAYGSYGFVAGTDDILGGQANVRGVTLINLTSAVADLHNIQQGFEFNDLLCEGCTRLLVSPSAAGVSIPVKFSGVKFELGSLHADSQIIQYGYSGLLDFQDCTFGQGPGTRNPIFRFNGFPGLRCTARFVANKIAADGPSINFSFNGNGLWDIRSALNTFIGSDQLPISTANLLEVWKANVLVDRVGTSGYRMTRKKAAPADADLSNSELSYWLDDTPGATKAMYKAKDSGGTVRTGSLSLT